MPEKNGGKSPNEKLYKAFKEQNYNVKIIYMSPEKLSLSPKTQALIKDLHEKRLIS